MLEWLPDMEPIEDIECIGEAMELMDGDIELGELLMEPIEEPVEPDVAEMPGWIVAFVNDERKV